MPPAAADKQPLKCNVYEYARTLVSTLTPMFPYVDEGAMVPTIALFYGQPGGDYGYFEHENTFDEVAIVFGSGATTGRGKAGLVRASASRPRKFSVSGDRARCSDKTSLSARISSSVLPCPSA